MEIRRIVDGKEHTFTLSRDELANAYFEQEYTWDLEDMTDWVDNIGDDMMDSYGVSYSDMKSCVGYLASEIRRNITKYDFDYSSARDQALHDVSKWIKDGTIEV